MPWEDQKEMTVPVSEVAELVFRIAAPTLPVGHAVPLYTALLAELPWLAGDPLAGIHEIHGAASGNGWTRPEPGSGGNGILHLSRRARLVLRLGPAARAAAARLCGATLDVAGHAVTVGAAHERPLQPTATQFARRVVCNSADEAAFEAALVAELADRGLRVRKLICGRAQVLRTPHGCLHARGVMLAALRPAEALRLQERPLFGPGTLGCGLFVPHKGIEPVAGPDAGG